MRLRHPLPRTWLMTDERLGDELWEAIARLPRGSGIIFRHYATPLPQRRLMFARISRIAAARRLVLLRAGQDRLARQEQGVHNARRARDHRWMTAAAHDRVQAIAARRSGADAILVSPLFATRSHPGQREIGMVGLARISRGIGLPVIALGGMNAKRARTLGTGQIYGWAGIGAWLS